jgi:pyruvate/2-oxoglutarate dehydrogenase complex dihydrolipoamide dehydrogenase (E3) component
MDETFDLVIIGAGEAGQAAAYLARARGASVVIVDRELFGGSCPYWACMPSKALLHDAAIHHLGGDYPWQRASDFRDWMIVREHRDWPDDSGHVNDLEAAGAVVIRGEARLDGLGKVVVRTDTGERTLGAKAILVSVGTNSTIPDDIEGLDDIRPWTNREATSTRELPKSLVVLGAGPTGVEMSQVFARYGVPTILVSPHDRINPQDHPRNSATLDAALRRDGVDIRTGVRAIRVRPEAGAAGAHAVELSDGATVDGHEILVAVGRTAPLARLGLETAGYASTMINSIPTIDCESRTTCMSPATRRAPKCTPTWPSTRVRWRPGSRSARTCGPTSGRSRMPPTPSRRRPASGSGSRRPATAASTPSRRRPTTRRPRRVTSPRRQVT